MAIMLDLNAEEEQEMHRRAEYTGQTPLSREDWERLLDELAETVPADVPLLSDYAVSREGMYEERVAQILGDDYNR